MRELPEGFELDDGRLVPLHTGGRSAWVAGRLAYVLSVYCDRHNLGWCFGAGTVYRFFSRRTARRPDFSFIRYGRLLHEELPEEDLDLAPDLAGEVISPGDLVEELDWKLDDYFRAGVRLVWVINPQTKVVLVHRDNGTSARFGAGQELDGEDVVSGFRCSISELWPETHHAPTQFSRL